MAKEQPAADQPEDIPAWFMTYSDVITLLMTFFILLLTFSTTEPERFEKVQETLFGSSGATGVAGHAHEKLDKNSFSQRVRPRAARIALQGSEMPPIMEGPVMRASGRGLKAATEEEKQNDVMKVYSFHVKVSEIIDQNNNLTRKGTQLVTKLAKQLRKLPVHCAIEIRNQEFSDRATALAHHLYHVENVRPGQVGVGYVDDVDTDSIRFVIERYQP